MTYLIALLLQFFIIASAQDFDPANMNYYEQELLENNIIIHDHIGAIMEETCHRKLV